MSYGGANGHGRLFSGHSLAFLDCRGMNWSRVFSPEKMLQQPPLLIMGFSSEGPLFVDLGMTLGSLAFRGEA
jgi:hypothetical protein